MVTYPHQCEVWCVLGFCDFTCTYLCGVRFINAGTSLYTTVLYFPHEFFCKRIRKLTLMGVVANKLRSQEVVQCRLCNNDAFIYHLSAVGSAVYLQFSRGCFIATC